MAVTRSRAPILATACFGLFFVQLDLTVVNVALKQIGGDLGAGRATLQWVVDAYALFLASLMLSAGDLADRAGRRRVFLLGLGIFGAGSLGAAAAPSAGALIAARAVQGLGAAALLPTSLAIVNDSFPEPRERAQAVGAWAGVAGLALVAGPILGGGLVQGLGWRSVFWLNLPLCALAGVATLKFVPESSGERRRVDVTGQLLATGALATLVFALIEGGRLGFGSVGIVVAIAACAACAAGFVARERRVESPMLDLSHFRSPAFSAANAASGLMNLGMLGLLFALSLFFQRAQGRSPLETGVRLVPLFLPLVALAPLGGRLVGFAGSRVPAALGLGITGAALLVLSPLGPGTGYGAVWWPLALASLGLAAATPALVTAATGALPPQRAGIASAVNNTARQAGGAVGVALIGALPSVHASLLASAGALLAGAALAVAIGR